MKILEIESALLGLVLTYPDHKIAGHICAELDSDKFSTTAHRLIYASIQELVIERKIPTSLNVSNKLASNLETIGGLSYLQSLLGFVKLLNLGLPQEENYGSWVRLIDSAGRLRHIGLLVDKYHKMYEDFDKLMTEVSDPDEFTANFMTELNQGFASVKSEYKHISSATAELRRRLEVIRQGGTVDLAFTGMPSFEGYFIPRPFSLGVVSGLPSMGKTQLALQLLLGSAISIYDSGLPGCVSINTLEMPGWRMANRLACCLACVDSDELDSGRILDNPKEEKRYQDQLDFIDQLPIEYDDNPNVSSKSVLWNAIAQHNLKGPRRMGVTDYLQLLKDSNDNSEELRVSGAIKNQQLIARETGSAEISISPMNNAVLLHQDKLGSLSNARYSGIIAYDADWGGIVYNPPQMRKKNIHFTLPDGFSNDLATFVLEKNRDHKVGKIDLEWNPNWTQFRDLALPMGQLFRRHLSDF